MGREDGTADSSHWLRGRLLVAGLPREGGTPRPLTMTRGMAHGQMPPGGEHAGGGGPVSGVS
jgi:hypothetical protein